MSVFGKVTCIVCRKETEFHSELAYKFCSEIRNTYQCPDCSNKYNNVLRYIPDFHNKIVGELPCCKCKKPLRITSNNIYALAKVRGIMCFSCSGRKKLTYEEAKAYMSTIGLKTKEEWFNWCKEGKRPSFLPYNPDRDFKEQWCGWPNFLSAHSKTKETYTKKCPSCRRKMEYTCKSTLTESIKNNRICGKCREKQKKL